MQKAIPQRKYDACFSFYRWETGSERLTLLKSELASGPPESKVAPDGLISPSTKLGGGERKGESAAPEGYNLGGGGWGQLLTTTIPHGKVAWKHNYFCVSGVFLTEAKACRGIAFENGP